MIPTVFLVGKIVHFHILHPHNFRSFTLVCMLIHHINFQKYPVASNGNRSEDDLKGLDLLVSYMLILLLIILRGRHYKCSQAVHVHRFCPP